MLNENCKAVINQSREMGWVLEPDAKEIMQQHGLYIPKAITTRSFAKADQFLKKLDMPVVVKAVSPKILHKIEHRAVVTNITSSHMLKQEMDRLKKLPGCEKILVEQMIQGVEIMIGSKIDYQFGPVVILGMGGTSVEIYKDTAIRMAPLKPEDAFSMIDSLKARDLIWGYRGQKGINIDRLSRTMVRFSHLIMTLENDIESIDLNPVICTQEKCTIADARIILNRDNPVYND